MAPPKLRKMTWTTWGLLAFAAMPSGCPLTNEVPNGEPPAVSVATAPENAAAVNGALAEAERMLASGGGTAEARAGLLARLQADPQVAAASQDADSLAIWADFRNGEAQCFTLLAAAADPDGSLNPLGAAAAPAARARDDGPRAVAKKMSTAQGTGLDTYYRMPANNRALLANALTAFHADKPYTDSTAVLERILTARGYQVDRAELTVADFTRLTQYGVIVLEAHGTWREHEYPAALLQLPPLPGLNPYAGTCGGDAGRMALLTTTVVTPQNALENAADIACGRLVLWNVSLRQPNGRVSRQQRYGVTPNYVREHDQGTFPSNAILLLNACRGFDQNMKSAYESLLYEKCGGGACFLGWTAKVDYAYAGRAALYLFQLAAGANEELTIDGVSVLRKFEPPVGGPLATLRGAWGQINQKGYTFDPQTLGQLIYADQQRDHRDMTLMPQLIDWTSGRTPAGANEYFIYPFTVGVAPALTIGSSAVSLTRENGSPLSRWRVAATAAPYGDMVLTEQGRGDVPRVLHRWRPSITITNAGGNVNYTVVLTGHVRSALDTFRSSAWSAPPPAGFADAYWDNAHSVVTWNVNGEYTDNQGADPLQYSYSGSGARAFDASEWGQLQCADDGASVTLSAAVQITYTVAVKNLRTGETQTYTETAGVSFDRAGVSLSANWTVAAANYQASGGGTLGNHQVRWNAVAAEPPFAAAAEPR